MHWTLRVVPYRYVLEKLCSSLAETLAAAAPL